MKETSGGPSQTTLLLRLLCGGYLVYLGIGLLAEGAGALFAAAAGVFIIAGAVLLFFTLRTGLKNWKKKAPGDPDGADKDEV